jgi:predicted metalloendopeptidase
VPSLWAQTSTSAPKKDVRFSPDLLDKSIDPCNDFYAYACSKWQAQNPVPADRPAWGRFNELQERGEYIVRDILEKAAAKTAGRSPNEQKIGDYRQLHGRARSKKRYKPLITTCRALPR